MEVDSRKASEAIKKAGHVIFDFDGTLYKINVDWKDLKDKLYRKAAEMGLQGTFGSLRELYTLSSDHPVIKTELIRIQTGVEMKGMKDSNGIMQGIKAARWRLSRGMGCSICSSNTGSTLAEMVGNWGFDPIIALDDVSQPKPDPEGLLRIINGLEGSPDDVIMVGNSEFDSQAAEQAGIEYIDVSDMEERLFE
jgi:pyrophosphatase PpaX